VRRLIPTLILPLAACAAAPQAVPGYRDTGAPIYSNAVIDMAALQGDWTQVAAFSRAPLDCDRPPLRLAPAPGGLAATGRLCGPGGTVDVATRLAFTGPGRLTPDGGPDWWVVWADTSLRTIAIGTPDGRFGFILDRTGNLPPDRREAAREVFDFNGYATGYLQDF
jgi:apolipoprotein D and lipocalin family protein